MPMLSDKDRQFLEEYFEQSLTELVTIKLFTQSSACQFCKETRQLLEEVEGLSDKIELQVHDLVEDKDEVDKYAISRIPATIVMGKTDYGIRFYGIPSGYEFNTLIEDIVAVSNDTHGLSDSIVEQLARIKDRVHMQVFVTPTCPYCPTAVRAAHAFAMASDKITADMIEAVEFPQLANRYNVMGVPKTIINESTELEGAAPEELVLAKVLEAVGLMDKAAVDELFAGYEGELETT